jgi:uroporphyrin-III C-methyltransferase / precorrin-2 dehydrogenase / sirohydrochlorin ferrochelatase
VSAKLFPTFLKLAGRRVVVVGGGPVAASKLAALVATGADITVIAPDVVPAIRIPGVRVEQHEFADTDLDGAWFVVAAAPPDVNRRVAASAEARHLFVNAVDDPAHASAYLGGVVRKDGVTLAISTEGRAPALAGLLREGLEASLPEDLDEWLSVADRARQEWKATEVPMAERRPRLLAAINALYQSDEARPLTSSGRAVAPSVRPAPFEGRATVDAGPTTGRVALVGAGPGDPGLLTRRAVQLLRHADLVLYDALVPTSIVGIARTAKRFHVGKRHGRHAISQDTIHRLMIRGASRGQRVVRLKGGDPFVFGRGGEEALALRAAGVHVEIVPGVSSAIAAAALAGIPVTHRGVAPGVVIVSGHAEAAYGPVIDSLAPRSVTVVVLMGLMTRGAIAGRLLRRGWPSTTPAAIVSGAGQAGARAWTGRLDALGEATIDVALPGTIVIGDVVALAALIGGAIETTVAGDASGVRHQLQGRG